MVEKILQLLSVRCSHRNLSKPFTAGTDAAAPRDAEWMPVGNSGPSHYVVCLDCGKKFGYDWHTMKVVR
ncbi:MAG TPA: hypothetical protein VE734_10530 [Terriglobales bacterium]|jgi:hypothetical protein|nr:hypothetical protein [Terriglobales bacterium]